MLIEHRYDLRGPSPAPFVLYSALSRSMPEAHGTGWAISPCHHRSGFVVRGPAIAPAIEALMLRREVVPVRLRESVEVDPGAELWASIVVIKLTVMSVSPDAFRAAIDRHVRERCAALGIHQVELCAERTVRVHGRGIRGFEVRASADRTGAAALLAAGLGGKRSMGCGVFHAAGSPWR